MRDPDTTTPDDLAAEEAMEIEHFGERFEDYSELLSEDTPAGELPEDEVTELEVEFTPEDDADEGPDFPDGPEFEGFDDRAGDAESEVSPFDGEDSAPAAEDTSEDEVAAVIPTDDDGYLAPPAGGSEEPLVVVQDFDPADPGAEIPEPQKVFHPHDRIARKRARGSRE